MRIRTLVALAVLAGMVISAQAQTGAVYSLNVVGFQKMTVNPSALRLTGTPFDPNDPELNEVIGDQLHASTKYAGADRVLTWDVGTAQYVKYWLKTNGGGTGTNAWVEADTGLVSTNADVPPGVGYWVQSLYASTQQMVLVGDVVDDETFTVPMVGSDSFNLVAYPYATATKLNEMQLTNGTASSKYAGADKVWVWDENDLNYVTYWLKSSGGSNFWVRASDGTYATNVIAPGEGFWYTAKAAFNWESVRPYTLD